MEAHPREETEKQRQYHRMRLRTWAEGKLQRHGQPFFPDNVSVIDAPLKFKDGRIGHMTWVQDKIEGQKINTLMINVYKTQDTLGPLTQYKSDSPGEFTRSDIDPSGSGSPRLSEIEEMFDGGADIEAAILAGSILGAASQIRNKNEGLDSHPISAQEAYEVLDLLKTARVGNF